jgi:hypothetical protein
VLIHQLSAARSQAPFKKGKGRVEAVSFCVVFVIMFFKTTIPLGFVSSYETVLCVGIATHRSNLQSRSSKDV